LGEKAIIKGHRRARRDGTTTISGGFTGEKVAQTDALAEIWALPRVVVVDACVNRRGAGILTGDVRPVSRTGYTVPAGSFTTA
jgi:hypothetical protein